MNEKNQKNKVNIQDKNFDAQIEVKKNENIKYAIQIKNLTKNFNNFKAIDRISFNVKKGEIHGFIGPNGAGKTTTIKCLISSIVFNEGEILLNNLPSQSLEAKKNLGYIPEKAIFPKNISTQQFLISMCQLSWKKRRECVEIINRKLLELNLEQFKNKSPNNYSSGMKKKVLLIQALVNDPDIIIMDEPAANLDPTARTELFNDLKTLRNQGKTVFISSHILSELQDIVDAVTILNKGKVVYSGTTKNQNPNDYQIQSSNNQLLYDLLKKEQFVANIENDKLKVIAKSDLEINKISKLALENAITIYSFQLQTTNLQQLYEKLVIETPKENL